MTRRMYAKRHSQWLKMIDHIACSAGSFVKVAVFTDCFGRRRRLMAPARPCSPSPSSSTMKEAKQFIEKPEWARRPLLGFSTWSTQLLDDVPGYGGKHVEPWFNENNIKEISDVMKLKMPQYEYINLDSGWCETFDEYGRWTFRQKLFPNGLRSLSDYLAKNGHKLGVYILPGIRKDALEANTPIKGTNYRLADIVKQKKEGNGSKGTTFMPDANLDAAQMYYDSMAELFAEWGVRFVKVDGCGPGGGDQFYPYQSPDNRQCLRMMSRSFRRYDIWMELSWYMDHSYADEWAELANGARIFVDIESYSTKTMTSSHRVFQRITQASRWVDTGVIGKDYGFYLDLDVVLVGMTVNGKCVDGLDNDDVRRSYISFWALLSTVFCIGSDPRMIPDKYLNQLNHPDILYVHQSGIMARPVGSGDVWLNRKQIWWKELPDGRICCGIFNAHTYVFMLGFSHEIILQLADLNIGPAGAIIYDIWEGKELGRYTEKYSVRLRPGQCQMLFLTALVSPSSEL